MNVTADPRASRDCSSMSSYCGKATPIAMLMATVMLAFASQIPAVIVAASALSGAYGWVMRPRRPITGREFWLFGITCLLFLPAFANLHHGLSPIYYFFSTIAVFFAAQSVCRSPSPVLLKAFRWVYIAAIGAIAWILYTYWGYVEPFGMVIEGSSTNAIPAYLIVLQIGLSLSTYATYGRLPVLSALLTFAAAFFGNGRGSLVVAALIVAATFVLNLSAAKLGGRSQRLRAMVTFVLAVLGLALYGDTLFDWITDYTKLSAGLVDTNRLEILDDYWNKIDPFTLMFGAEYAGTVIAYEYLGNPHIAYIRTHSFFGLPVTLLALLSPLAVLFARKVIAAKLVFFIFISLAVFRAASEPIFFPTLLDFFYFCYFMIFFNHVPDSGRITGTGSLSAAPPARRVRR